jgi:hypothetical protein
MLKDESEKVVMLIGALRKSKELRTKREVECICQYMRQIESFKRFTTRDLLQLIEQSSMTKVPKGTMREVDFSHFFILIKG